MLGGHARPNEPALLQTMRGDMRVVHYAADTEKAYVRWVQRFMKHVGSQNLEQFDEKDIKNFLTQLAVRDQVSPSTQRQAQSALLFVYCCVLGKRTLGFTEPKGWSYHQDEAVRRLRCNPLFVSASRGFAQTYFLPVAI